MGSEKVANASRTNAAVVSKTGVGYVAANGSNVKNNGERTSIGYADSGDGVDVRIQHADVKKVLGSVNKMNMGGNVVVLGGQRESYVEQDGGSDCGDEL